MLILTIWPIFALILLGAALARGGVPGAGFWPAAERLNYMLLFPALLVATLADAPLSDPALLRLGGAVVLTILIAFALLVIFRRLRPMPASRFGPSVQGVIRFNTYLGLAVTASLAGPAGVERAAVLLAIAVPLVNVLSIAALTEAGAGAAGTLRRMARAIWTNPLILACVLGFALALGGVGLPFGADRFMGLLGQASLPLGLLTVGAALRPAAVGRDVAALAGVGVARLVLMPVLAAGVAWALALGGTEALVLIVFAAIPTAPTAYVLTTQLRGDGPYMAGLITSQTLASALTLPLILAILP